MKSRQDFTTEEDYSEYLRTYFAAMAMQGLITGFDKDGILSKYELVQRAVQYADELLIQLSLKK